LTYLKSLDFVQFDRIGTVGFCAGGGNAWNLAVNLEELAAMVAFYGTPLPSAEEIARIKSPVLGIYAELDRNLTLQTPGAITQLINQRKTFGFHIYQGANHAFHNDTSPSYDAAASCDAWSRTLAWFNKFLRTPAAA
jgi:carboxymethylenebutenolidase